MNYNRCFLKAWTMGIIIFFLILTVGCQQIKKEINLGDIPRHTGTTFIMDTLIQMQVYGEGAEEVVDLSFERLQQIEEEMSINLEDSQINKINLHPEEFVRVKEDTFKVIKKAVEYAEITDGRFDPSIGPLVKLWGIGTEQARVPSAQEIEAAKKMVDYKLIELDEDESKVKLTREGMMLDLGAIAKGYAAEEARQIIIAQGIESAYINLGGNVLVVGGKPDGTPWNVGIQDPRENRGNVMASIEVRDKTIVTSGNYERYFKQDGKIYHHILDPRTGYPARSGITGVSIITGNSFDADALSTAVFIMGAEKGLELIEGIQGAEAMIIKNNLDIITTSGLKDKIKLLNSDFNFTGM